MHPMDIFEPTSSVWQIAFIYCWSSI